MRIVALADTHLHHGIAVPDGDVLVHAGDALQHGSLDELDRAIAWLRTLPHRTKIFVAGNHEICLARRAEEARARLADAGITYLEDAAMTVDGLLFYGAPWQPRFRFWAFGAKRGAELAAKWAKIPDAVDVLVTHGPPMGFGDRIVWAGIERRIGCADLAARVRAVAPALHLFGHIHQDPGVWTSDGTIYANVTTADGVHAARAFDLTAEDVRTRPSEPPATPPSPRRTRGA